MSDVNVCALDPGGTTGLATLQLDKTFGPFGETPDTEALYDILLGMKPQAIVCERFDLRHMGADLAPVEAIGVIKLARARLDVPIYWQTPSQAKGFWKNEKLKLLEVYKPGMPHAMDAMRHLLWHVSFTLKNETFLSRVAHSS